MASFFELFCFFVKQAAKKEIAMIKVVAPQVAQKVVDRAMQVCLKVFEE